MRIKHEIKKVRDLRCQNFLFANALSEPVFWKCSKFSRLAGDSQPRLEERRLAEGVSADE
jgi:hypothetical protein